MSFNFPSFFRSAVLLVSVLVGVGGCGGGGGTTTDNGGGSTLSAPIFKGVEVAVPSAALGGEVTLNWNPASDDVSASEMIVYDISVATTAGAPFVATHTTAQGADTFTVTGLADDVDYFFVVRARDEAGNRDANTVEAATFRQGGVMNLRGAPIFGIPGAFAFTYRDANCASYTLDFGDSGTDIQNCPGDGGDVTVNHQYATAGTYTVTLTNDSLGTSEVIKLTITSALTIGTILNDVIIGTAATSGGSWFYTNPRVFIPAVAGATVSVADIESTLAAGKSVAITTVNANGDIIVNAPISWSANRLTLNSMRDIKINAVMSASGTALLDLEHEFFAGAVKMGFNPDGTFKGRVDFPARTGAGILTIGGYPYTLINDVTGLQNICLTSLCMYALGGDVDAAVTSAWNAGAGFMPLGDAMTSFGGRFDGLGHVVTGLVINRPTTDFVGLFGFINGARILNVGLTNGSVSGGNYVGGVAGKVWTGSDKIGNCYNTSSVSGNSFVGGVAGFSYGSIIRSHNGGIVGGADMVGGVAGESTGTGNSISDSYNTAAVTGSGASVGGLVGANFSGISDSYSMGGVSGTDSVGGLVGSNGGGSINNSYSAGGVSGSTAAGGLVGAIVGGSSASAYWDTQTSGQTSSAAGIGLTTAQMKAQASFAGWDFTKTWSIVEGVSYPTLRND